MSHVVLDSDVLRGDQEAERPLRVLFVSHSLPPTSRPLENLGGMQRVAADLVAAMGRDGRITLTLLGLRTSWRMRHVRTTAFFPKLLWSIPRLARSGGVDVVLFSSMVTATTVILLERSLRRYGVRSAAIVHGREVTLQSRVLEVLMRATLRRLDVVLPVSRATADACLGRGGAPERIEVVPNGVDLGAFRAPLERAEARARLSEDLAVPTPEPGGLLLVSVGRHVPRKGFEWFVRDVMPRLPPDTIYCLAGEGAETPRIARAIRECGLQDRVRLLGTVSQENLLHLYRAADLLLMPNIPVTGELEGFGVVILEAGLCGLPTCSADIEGMRDAVVEGENGWLVSAGDADAWVAVLSGLREAPERIAALRERAATYTRRGFAWPAVVERYLRVLTGRPLERKTGWSTRHGVGGGADHRPNVTMPDAAGRDRTLLSVLFVSHSFPPAERPLENVGGMQRLAADLAEALGQDSETRCTVIGLRATWRWTHVRTPGFVLRVLWQVRRAVRSGEVDVVLFSSLVTASVLLALRGAFSRCGVRAAAIVYGREVSRPFRPMRWVLRAIIRRLDVVLPISRAAADESVRCGADPASVRVVPCGVDPGRFDAFPDRETARAELIERLGLTRMDPNGLVLASVGRHVRRKGFGWFVSHVIPRLPPDVAYWIAGEGPETESIARAAEQHRCEGQVRLLGKVSHEDLVRLYRAADVFVMPNIQVEGDLEGFGLVITEAGLCGTPTLTADIEGMRDVVTEGENGWLVAAEDPRAWEEAIAGLRRDRAKLETVRAGVAAYTERHFAWPGVVAQYRRSLSETVVPRTD